MIGRIYIFVWILMGLLAGTLYITGSFNEITATVYGFGLTTLVFAGLVAVLPWWVDKHYNWKYAP